MQGAGKSKRSLAGRLLVGSAFAKLRQMKVP